MAQSCLSSPAVDRHRHFHVVWTMGPCCHVCVCTSAYVYFIVYILPLDTICTTMCFSACSFEIHPMKVQLMSCRHPETT